MRISDWSSDVCSSDLLDPDGTACPCVVDLKRIRNPLVIFASSGDNITPPHQALAWLPAIYPDTAALKAAGQRIVYLLNPHVGHLGIFVSASVARHEHRAIPIGRASCRERVGQYV